jgi:hypothetical protein
MDCSTSVTDVSGQHATNLHAATATLRWTVVHLAASMLQQTMLDPNSTSLRSTNVGPTATSRHHTGLMMAAAHSLAPPPRVVANLEVHLHQEDEEEEEEEEEKVYLQEDAAEEVVEAAEEMLLQITILDDRRRELLFRAQLFPSWRLLRLAPRSRIRSHHRLLDLLRRNCFLSIV